MAVTIGRHDPVLIARTAQLVPLAGLALAAAVPAHVIGATLKARGQALQALALLSAGHWGIGLAAMLCFSRAGLGTTGVWSALMLGAFAASLAAVLWHGASLRRFVTGAG